MKVRKVYNNNVVSSVDGNGKQIIVIGSGVGFQKKTGDPIPTSKVEQIYRLTDSRRSQFEELVENTPYEYIQIVNRIKDMAEKELECHLSDNIMITLTDHISFAIERQKQGIFIKNALLWEISKYYPKEWKASCRAQELINRELGVNMPKDEAGFIALHIVNAELNMDTMDGMQFPEMMKEILEIFRNSTGLKVREDSLSYERFVVHLKFFLQRVLKGCLYNNEEVAVRIDPEQYRTAYDCALRVKEYIEKRLECSVSEDEVVYLTIHMQRILMDNRNQ